MSDLFGNRIVGFPTRRLKWRGLKPQRALRVMPIPRDIFFRHGRKVFSVRITSPSIIILITAALFFFADVFIIHNFLAVWLNLILISCFRFDQYEITSTYQEFKLKVQNDTMFHHHRGIPLGACVCCTAVQRIERPGIEYYLYSYKCTDEEPQTLSIKIYREPFACLFSVISG